MTVTTSAGKQRYEEVVSFIIKLCESNVIYDFMY